MERKRLIGTNSASPLAIDADKRKDSRLALVATFLVPAVLVTPYVHPVTAMFTIGAGAYRVHYWIFQAGLS